MIDTVMDDSAGVIAGLTLSTRGLAGLAPQQAEFELLLLPLRHGGKTHARLVGALAPLVPPLWLGHAQVDDAEIRSMRVIWPSGLPRHHAAAQDGRPRFTLLQGGRSDR
jgi:hypothetical protein